jgi:stringent starvation protein B
MAENGVRVMTLRNDVTNFKMLLAGLRKDVYIPLKKHFETV